LIFSERKTPLREGNLKNMHGTLLIYKSKTFLIEDPDVQLQIKK